MATFTVERLTRQDWRRLKAIRVRSLRDESVGSGGDYAKAVGWLAPDWRREAGMFTWAVGKISGEDVAIGRMDRLPDPPVIDGLWSAPLYADLNLDAVIVRYLEKLAGERSLARPVVSRRGEGTDRSVPDAASAGS